MLFEVEVKLQNASVERALESVALRHLPLSIYDCECDILIRCSSIKANCQRIVSAVLLKVELWSIRLVCQVWVEDVELVALDHFGRRIL